MTMLALISGLAPAQEGPRAGCSVPSEPAAADGFGAEPHLLNWDRCGCFYSRYLIHRLYNPEHLNQLGLIFRISMTRFQRAISPVTRSRI
jgi:hypothetical protein